MRRNDALYYAINLTFITIAFCCINFTIFNSMEFSPLMILSLCLLLILVHTFKFFRMYFILLEEKLPFTRALKLYIKTTFVSTLIPFKIGEIFKMYSYGIETKYFPKGIIAVLIEKFFDAIVLCLILIPANLLSAEPNFTFSVVLAIFVIIIATFYWAYRGTYKYLNRFFMTSATTKRSVHILTYLEYLQTFFKTTKQMLQGRGFVILLLSILAWISECAALFVMGFFMKTPVNFNDINNYLSAGFYGVNNTFLDRYLYLCMTIFLLILIIVYAYKFINWIINNRRKL